MCTGVNQTAGKLQLERMDQMAEQGFGNFVEVSAHTGARSDGSGGSADHAAWQGKVYHRGGRIYHQGEWYEDFEAATGYGTGEGLCGWNCRHNFHPFWPGISKRNYTDEQLAAMNEANVPYNGKLYTRYEINQMQRALERKVRSAKRKYLAESAAGVDASRSAVRLKAARQQLNKFIRTTGGRADSSRTSVAGFGRSEASKATWAAKPFARFRKENTASSVKELLPNHKAALIPSAKLSGYALNMNHPKGKDKAIAFRDALGYTASNETDLIIAIRNGLHKWKATERPTTQHGRPFEVKMLLAGPNGKQATVKTAWQIDNGSDTPRLVSAYVYKDKGE